MCKVHIRILVICSRKASLEAITSTFQIAVVLAHIKAPHSYRLVWFQTITWIFFLHCFFFISKMDVTLSNWSVILSFSQTKVYSLQPIFSILSIAKTTSSSWIHNLYQLMRKYVVLVTNVFQWNFLCYFVYFIRTDIAKNCRPIVYQLINDNISIAQWEHALVTSLLDVLNIWSCRVVIMGWNEHKQWEFF